MFVWISFVDRLRVVSEAMTHAVLPWVPQDRARQVLGLRYQSQHMGAEKQWPRTSKFARNQDNLRSRFLG